MGLAQARPNNNNTACFVVTSNFKWGTEAKFGEKKLQVATVIHLECGSLCLNSLVTVQLFAWQELIFNLMVQELWVNEEEG